MGEESKYKVVHEEPPCKSWKVEWSDLLQEHLAEAKPFKPQAIFSSERSCVTILLRDCSMEERRVNDEFTLLFANHFKDEFGNKQLAGIRVDDTRRINRITKAFDDMNVILILIEKDEGAPQIVREYAGLARKMIL